MYQRDETCRFFYSSTYWEYICQLIHYSRSLANMTPLNIIFIWSKWVPNVDLFTLQVHIRSCLALLGFCVALVFVVFCIEVYVVDFVCLFALMLSIDLSVIISLSSAPSLFYSSSTLVLQMYNTHLVHRIFT